MAIVDHFPDPADPHPIHIAAEKSEEDDLAEFMIDRLQCMSRQPMLKTMDAIRRMISIGDEIDTLQDKARKISDALDAGISNPVQRRNLESEEQTVLGNIDLLVRRLEGRA